jgi:hypothetical protein
MKPLLSVFFAAFLFSACTLDTLEPRYDARNNIIGYYQVEEHSATYNDVTYYSMRISKSRYSREIYLDNFYVDNLRVSAIYEYNNITIPYQVVDGYEIEGVGSFSGNQLKMSYSVKDRYNNSQKDFCETKSWFDYY